MLFGRQVGKGIFTQSHVICFNRYHIFAVPGASNNSCSQVYYGPTAESESEVRHLARYILAQKIDENDAYVSVHAAAQMILYPYMYKENEMTPFDSILVCYSIIHALLEK